MTFATANAAGRPTARTVLLKGLDERGFVLFTNRSSRKGREALANPRAALTLPWLALQRQILVTGAVSVVSEEESDAYWATRPRGSQIAAAASPQSTVVASRAELEALWAALAERHPDGTPVPAPAALGRAAGRARRRGAVAGAPGPPARPAALPAHRRGRLGDRAPGAVGV